MAISLVDDLAGQFRTQALSEAAATLGECFQTASATILGGLTSKIGQAGEFRSAWRKSKFVHVVVFCLANGLAIVRSDRQEETKSWRRRKSLMAVNRRKERKPTG